MNSSEKRPVPLGPYRPTVILHGGAGNLSRNNLPPDLWAKYQASLLKYLTSTRKLLDSGATALDAATHAVALFEDDPLFNCGRGAVFTENGTVELEASVMVASVNPNGPPAGYIKRAAAVSLIKNTRHPILLAKEVLIASDDDGGLGGTASMHTHLSGRELEEWGWDERGLEKKADQWFWTKKRWEEHRRGLHSDSPSSDLYTFADLLASVDPLGMSHEGSNVLEFDVLDIPSQGTVGAVTLDSWGNLATATSTGGLTNKKAGRIGDTPTVGAGFWAESWEEDVTLDNIQQHPSTDMTLLQHVSETILNSAKAVTGCFDTKTTPAYEYTQLKMSPPPYSSVANTTPAVLRPMSFQKSATSPLIRRAVALSGTGNGDSFLRTNAVRTAASISRFSPNHPSLSSAVTSIAGPGGELQQSAGNRWGRTGEGQGGIIGIEISSELADSNSSSDLSRHQKLGQVVFDFNCGGLFRAFYEENGKGEEVPHVAVFKEEY